MKRKAPTTIDEYIAGFPDHVRVLLNAIRSTISKAAPRATEKISYQIPTFTLNGNLVHFAAYRRHIGFYPGASGIKAFSSELSAYAGAKGSVQFPLGEPLALRLISRIVRFRVAENLRKSPAASRKKVSSRKRTTRRRSIPALPQ
jgi:uncharacterized protein YdhG (YjbR/CyaY superfamily)